MTRSLLPDQGIASRSHVGVCWKVSVYTNHARRQCASSASFITLGSLGASKHAIRSCPHQKAFTQTCSMSLLPESSLSDSIIARFFALDMSTDLRSFSPANLMCNPFLTDLYMSCDQNVTLPRTLNPAYVRIICACVLKRRLYSVSPSPHEN